MSTTTDRITVTQQSPQVAAPFLPALDAYAPAEIARRVRDVGVTKASLPAATTFALAVLAGAFISLGALFFAVTVTAGSGTPASFGMTRLAGGASFSLGLVLVVVGGGELFTGNNLLAMAWAARRIGTRQVLRNWALVYAGNLAGALGTALLVYLAGIASAADGAVGRTMVAIAQGKLMLDPVAALARGVLCNVLVCLAVWLCMGARSVTDKVLAILLPISAFVACGFEHSVANMFFLPMGLILVADGAALSIGSTVENLVLVTLGNIAGGTVLVALVYWFVYLRADRDGAPLGSLPPQPQ